MSPKKTFEEINPRFLEAARDSMIRLLAMAISVLALATSAQAQDRPPLSNKCSRPMDLSPSVKSRKSATPLTSRRPD
jgi:hypothetical protein